MDNYWLSWQVLMLGAGLAPVLGLAVALFFKRYGG